MFLAAIGQFAGQMMAESIDDGESFTLFLDKHDSDSWRSSTVESGKVLSENPLELPSEPAVRGSKLSKVSRRERKRVELGDTSINTVSIANAGGIGTGTVQIMATMVSMPGSDLLRTQEPAVDIANGSDSLKRVFLGRNSEVVIIGDVNTEILTRAARRRQPLDRSSVAPSAERMLSLIHI